MKIKKGILIVCFLILSIFLVHSQEHITLNYSKTSLSHILINLRDSLNVNFSFNDAKLSAHDLTIAGTFESIDEILVVLLKSLPYRFEHVGNVYVIVEISPDLVINSNKTILINGLVADKFSGEILPYSTVKINDELRITDVRGRFSYVAFADNMLHINATYLGYYVYDTIIQPQEQFICDLLPSNLELGEVRVEGKTIEYTNETGNAVGEVRLNQKMASYMPGGLNNSVYNILKMQAGIQASQEHASDLSMWGSGLGQNLTKFDGISIYSLNNFSEFISSVNPLLVKDINIYKGGFGSNQGNRVGGIIEINGIDGNYNKPSVTAYTDNRSINAMVSTPLFKRSALVLAHRRTILNGFNSELNSKLAKHDPDNFSNLYYLPENAFQDVNLKFSSFISNGDQFYVSLFNSRAESNANLDYNDNELINYSNASILRQTGFAAYYSKLWSNAITSNFKVSYSGYNNHNTLDTSYSSTLESDMYALSDISNNRIDEIGFTCDNRFSLTEQQFVDAGIELNRYVTTLNYDTKETSILNLNESIDKVSAYVRNNIHANKKLTMDIGLRLDYVLNSNKLLFQPRIRSSLDLPLHFKLNLSWGIYNQFISMLSFIDPEDNYHFYWNVPNADNTDILQANILSYGLSWTGSGFLLNAESYIRKTEGLYRYTYKQGILFGSNGISESFGFDVYLKKDISKHTFWMSYTFNNSKEYFDNFATTKLKPVRYNVSNEFKLASVFNFSPFYLSANYIYASGFNSMLISPLIKEEPYSRFDASAYYKFNLGNSKLRLGFNVLNVLNQKNYPYLSRTQLNSENQSPKYISMANQALSALFFVSVSY